MAYYLILYALKTDGTVSPDALKSGPFIDRGRAEEALAQALGSGRFARGEISQDTYPGFPQ